MPGLMGWLVVMGIVLGSAWPAAGDSPLTFAAMNGDTASVQALLAAGAEVNYQYESRGTALLWAAGGGHTASVQALLAAGAEVNLQDEVGRTALGVAAENGHTYTAALLRSAGATE